MVFVVPGRVFLALHGLTYEDPASTQIYRAARREASDRPRLLRTHLAPGAGYAGPRERGARCRVSLDQSAVQPRSRGSGYGPGHGPTSILRIIAEATLGGRRPFVRHRARAPARFG